MAVYIYLRVSTDNQDYENQKHGIIEFCKSRNFTIDKEIKDVGVSGTREASRRELGKLLKKLRSGDVLIVSELSRLGRKLFMLFRILEDLLSKGVKVYSIKDGYSLDNSIQSKVLAFAFGMAAEIERDMLSKRITEALAKKKADGVILGRPKGKKSSIYKLSGKEERISELLYQNVSKRKIAKKLGVSEITLNKFIKNNIL